MLVIPRDEYLAWFDILNANISQLREYISIQKLESIVVKEIPFPCTECFAPLWITYMDNYGSEGANLDRLVASTSDLEARENLISAHNRSRLKK